MSPRLVVLEGPDGVGKTRHARALAEALTVAGTPSLWWCHQPPQAPGTSWAHALHYAAEREALRVRIARGAYDAARYLVCDRWWYSTHALGIATDNRPLISLANAESNLKPRPYCMVLLDAPDDVLDARMAARGEEVSIRDDVVRRVYRSPRESGLELPGLVFRADTSGDPAAVTALLVRELA